MPPTRIFRLDPTFRVFHGATAADQPRQEMQRCSPLMCIKSSRMSIMRVIWLNTRTRCPAALSRVRSLSKRIIWRSTGGTWVRSGVQSEGEAGEREGEDYCQTWLRQLWTRGVEGLRAPCNAILGCMERDASSARPTAVATLSAVPLLTPVNRLHFPSPGLTRGKHIRVGLIHHTTPCRTHASSIIRRTYKFR